MAAGLPLLLIAFLGIVIQIGWMLGRKQCRRWRIAIGGFLIAGFFTCMLAVGIDGVFSNFGGLAFLAAWCLAIAMYLTPIMERVFIAIYRTADTK